MCLGCTQRQRMKEASQKKSDLVASVVEASDMIVAAQAVPPFRTDVKNCARCGGNHDQLLFCKFQQAPPDHTHWASCPATDEPILLKIVDDGES
jgi:hypothetical protein